MAAGAFEPSRSGLPPPVPARLRAPRVLRFAAVQIAPPLPDLKTFVEMRDKLHNALLESELREQDVARLEQRNALLGRAR
jgi:hypothetical protein